MGLPLVITWKAWDFITLLRHVRPQLCLCPWHQVTGGRRQKLAWFYPSSWSHSSAKRRGRVLSLGVLVLKALIAVGCHYHLGVCGPREQNEGGKMGDFPHSLSIRSSFLLSEPELQGISRLAVCHYFVPADSV